MNSRVCKICAAEKSRVTLREKKERRLALEAEAGKPIKKRVLVEKPGPGGVLGSDRLSTTLDTLCGDDLPKKGAVLSTENTVLLVLVAAVILYYLFFKDRGVA
jgi:hypothetical protein